MLCGPLYDDGLLRACRLGRKILRPLLRSEIGVVSARRAWHDASKLTQDVLDTYQRPLRVQNWDTALAEVHLGACCSDALVCSNIKQCSGVHDGFC